MASEYIFTVSSYFIAWISSAKPQYVICVQWTHLNAVWNQLLYSPQMSVNYIPITFNYYSGI